MISRDKSGNGIQEVVGSIPISSTNIRTERSGIAKSTGYFDATVHVDDPLPANAK